MSFHEKSAWVSMLSTAVVFVPYFVVVFQQPMAFGLLVAAVVLQVILLTGFHIVNAIATASIRKSGNVPKEDELDRLFELRAAKISGMVLSFVVVAWCMAAAVGVPALVVANAGGAVISPGQFTIPGMIALTAVHALFAGFVIANIVYYGAIIAGYRKMSYG